MIPRLVAVVVVCSVLFGAAVDAGPLRGDHGESCSKQCHSASLKRKLNYEPGKNYRYRYSAATRISTDGTSNSGVEVKIEALVDLTVIEGCQLAIQFHESRLTGPREQDVAAFRRDLEAEPLYFHFDDGRIGDLCASQSESEYVLNIKRGFLSSLQNSMNAFTGEYVLNEIDILGTCETNYTLSSRSWRGVVVAKTKDIRTCRDHHVAAATLFPTYVYAPESDIQNIPLFTNKYVCEQVFEKEIIKQVTCTEKNTLSPLVASKGNSEVETTITVNLEETVSSSAVRQVPATRQTTLLYEEPHLTPQAAYAEAEIILRELCPLVQEDIRPKTPKIYNQLAHVLKDVRASEIENLYQGAKNQLYCPSRKLADLVVDAAARAQTGDSQEFLATLIRRGDVSELRATYLYLLLSLAPRTSDEAIRAFLPILKDQPSRLAYLSISSMVGHSCHNRPNCRSSLAIQELLSQLANEIPNNCKTRTRQEESKLLDVLQAMGNIGVEGDTVDTVLQCAAKGLPGPVRIAAIEAFRHVPCQENVKEAVFNLVGDDTDTCYSSRIFAFKHFMRCPNAHDIFKIVNAYKEMKHHQMLSYMYSYFHYLHTTEDPTKQDVQLMLSAYPIDELQAYAHELIEDSRHYDFNTHSDILNFGLTDELDVIFPEDSYLPRILNSDFTLRTFGYHNNLFNVMTYGSGFDKYLDGLFGPDGYFSHVGDEVTKHFDRTKRSSASSKYTKLDLLQERMDSKLSTRRFDLLGKLRILGNDLFRLSFDDVEEFFNKDHDFDFRDFFKKIAENQKYELSRGIMFLDMHLAIPTISGLPMKLDLNGTAVLGLNMNGKIDLRDIGNLNADVDCTVEPSIAVELGTSLTIDALYVRPGMKIVANAHSSMPVGIRVLLKDGSFLKLGLKLPRNKLEVLNFRVNTYEIDNEGEKVLHSPKTKKVDFCTNFLGKPLGVEVCFDTEIPRPIYSEKSPFLPLSSPVSLSLSLKKTDQTMEGYELTFQVPDIIKHDRIQGLYKIEFDTPGSSVDRLLRAQLNTLCKDGMHSFRAELKTPFNLDILTHRPGEQDHDNKIVLAGSVRSQENNFGIAADLTLNQVKRYAVQFEMERILRNPTIDVKMSLELASPYAKPFILTGIYTGTSENKNKLDAKFEARSSVTGDDPFLLGNVNMEISPNFYRSASSVALNLGEYRFHAQTLVEKQQKSFMYERILKYQRPRHKEHTCKMVSKFQDLSTEHLTKLVSSSDLEFSEYPEYDFHSDADIQIKPGEHYEMDLNFCSDYGKCGPDGNRVFALAKVGPTNLRLESKLKVPTYGVDFEGEVDGQLEDNPRMFQLDVKGKNNGEDLPGFLAYYKRTSEDPIAGETRLTIRGPGLKDITFEGTIQKVSENEYKGQSVVTLDEGPFSIDYVYRTKDSPQYRLDHEVEATLTPSSGSPVLYKSRVQLSPSTLKVRSTASQDGKNTMSLSGVLSSKERSKIEFKVPDREVKVDIDVFTPKKAEILIDSIHPGINDNRGRFHLFAKADATDPEILVLEGKLIVGLQADLSVLGKLNSNILAGPHRIEVHIVGQNVKPSTLSVYHTLRDGSLRTGIDMDTEGKKYLLNEISGRYVSTDTRIELTGELIDKDKITDKHEDKRLSLSFVRDTSTGVNHNIEFHYVVEERDHYRLNIETARPVLMQYGEFKYILTVQTPEKGYETQDISLTGVFTEARQGAKLEVTRNSESLALAELSAYEDDQKGNIEVNVQTKLEALRSFQGRIDYIEKDVVVEKDRRLFSADLNANVKLNEKDLLVFKANLDQQKRKANFKLNTFLTPKITGEVVYTGENAYKYSLIIAGKPQLLAVHGNIAYSPDQPLTKGDTLLVVRGDKLFHIFYSFHNTDEVLEVRVEEIPVPFTLRLQEKTHDDKVSVTSNLCYQSAEEGNKCYGVDVTITDPDVDYKDRETIYLDLKFKRNNEVYLSLLYDYLEDAVTFRERLAYMRENRNYGVYFEKKEEGSKTSVDAELTLPSRVVRYARRSQDEEKLGNHEIELLPNALGEPSKKLTVKYTRTLVGCDRWLEEEAPIPCDSSYVLQLRLPDFKQPKTLSYQQKFTPGGDRLFEYKLHLELSSHPRDQFTVELYGKEYPENKNKKTVGLEFYDGERKRIDYSVVVHATNNNDLVDIVTNIHYLDENKNKQQGLFTLELRREEKLINIALKLGDIDLKGSLHITDNENEGLIGTYKYQVHGIEKKMRFLKPPNSKCTEMEYYSEEGQISSKEIMCFNPRVTRFLTFAEDVYATGEPVRDVTLAFDRLSNSVFDVHISVTPDRLGDIVLIASDLPEYMNSVSETNKAVQLLERDLSHILKVVRFQVGIPLENFVRPDLEAIGNDIEEGVTRAVEGMVKLGTAIEKFVEKLDNYLEKLFNQLENALEELLNHIEEHLPKELVEKLKELYERLDKYLETMCDAGTACSDILEEYRREGMVGATKEAVEKARNFPVEEVVNDLYKILKELVETVPGASESIEELQKEVEEFVNYIKELEVVRALKEYIDTEEVIEDLERYSKQLIAALKSAYRRAIESEIYKKTVELLNELYKDLEVIDSHYDDARLLRIAEDIKHRVIDDKTPNVGVQVLTNAAENGDFSFRIRLPFSVSYLRLGLAAFIQELLEDDEGAYPELPPEDTRDTIIELFSVLQDEVFPPYSQQANIIGGTHFSTFDAHFYSFANRQCSYVLARDFVNKKFTVLINYKGVESNGRPKKTFTYLKGNHAVEINPDTGIVTLDNTITELPIYLHRFTVTREGSSIVINDESGVMFDCSLEIDICSMYMSGYHFGKTAGLFGTYDNDLATDFQRPNGKLAPNTNSFAKSWEAEQGCKTNNLIKEEESSDENTEGHKICNQFFFNESSSLRDCFHQIYPYDDYEMCLSHTHDAKEYSSVLDSACRAAAAYSRRCNYMFVEVTVPPECSSQCQSGDLKIPPSKSLEVSGSSVPQSADVVFLIEENECNLQFVADIDSAARLIDKELNNAGLTNNHYGVMGYGGASDNSHNHIHTARGKVSFSVQDVVLAVEKFPSATFGKSRDSDVLHALRHVFDYPFRLGVSKNVVLVKCSSCAADFKNLVLNKLGGIGYSDIQNQFLVSGVKLHVLGDDPVEVRGSPGKSKGIYGVDADAVYRGKDTSQKILVGQPDLRSKVAVPKDLCVALAQEVDGSYFVKKTQQDRSSSEMKNVKSLLARRIAKTAGPEKCQKCQCLPHPRDESYVPICERCEVPKPKIPISVYITEESGYFR